MKVHAGHRLAAMEPEIKRSMLAYYDERANEYDQVYAGEFRGSTDLHRRAYAADTAAVKQIVRRFAKGSLLDAPCGTAFWLPAYAGNVERIVLMDQSAQMLDRARARVRDAGVDAVASFTQADLLSCSWPEQSFDTALAGFFLSHLTSLEITAFLTRVGASLRPEARVIVLDSLWTPLRAETAQKEGAVRRRLNDGREFDIYKRYFDAGDILALAKTSGFHAEIEYVGTAFIAATLRTSTP